MLTFLSKAKPICFTVRQDAKLYIPAIMCKTVLYLSSEMQKKGVEKSRIQSCTGKTNKLLS